MSPYYNAKLAFTRKCLRQCEKPGALPGIRFLWILLTAAAYRDLLKQVKKTIQCICSNNALFEWKGDGGNYFF
jgi:hypothetical protein